MRDKFGDPIEKKPKNPYSERFAIPQMANTAYQRRLRHQESCPHVETARMQTDAVHYAMRCVSCEKLVSSEVTGEDGGEIDEVML